MDAVIETFGRHRLLSFDRDPDTREPTVEIAHEALLREWARLRGWIDDEREDLRQRAKISSATAEWLQAERSIEYLMSGVRLAQAEEATTANTRSGSPRRSASSSTRASRIGTPRSRPSGCGTRASSRWSAEPERVFVDSLALLAVDAASRRA